MHDSIEDWELSAFALGELTAERSQEIEQMIYKDPRLARELASISELLGHVSEAMHVDSSSSLESDNDPSQGITPVESVSLVAKNSSEDASLPRMQHRRKTRQWWLGLSYVATAASFLALGYFGHRGLQAPSNLDVAFVPAKESRPEIERISSEQKVEEIVELQKQLKDIESTLAQTGAARHSSVQLQKQGMEGSGAPLPAIHPSSSPTSYAVTPSPNTPSTNTTWADNSRPTVLYADLDAKNSTDEKRSNSPFGGTGEIAEFLDKSVSDLDFRFIPAKDRELSLHRFGSESTSGDRFANIVENAFLRTQDSPFSTFSIDVDTASYTKARQYLLEVHQLPQASAIRIEEWINYFPYQYEGPSGDVPFGSALAMSECPWNPNHQLVRIALQAKKIDTQKRPVSNLVFLLDVSGSMNEPNKLPLVKESMRLLIDQLTENDRVSIVVYAGAAGLVLPSTTGDKKAVISEALDRLSAGGSTNGAQGIQLAYQIAREHFIPGATNRIILCTDGDFNVGVTSDAALIDLVEENAKSKVFLTVLGFGMGNTNDSMMEQITNRGNGLYGFVDSELEARRMMVEQLAGSLITVAKDVKIQVEFNPLQVSGYRLIGYENRMLATQDFSNDKKDAGEIGAGHCVTALYEIIPAGKPVESIPTVDKPRYQVLGTLSEAAQSNELLIVKLRYKQPEADVSSLLEFPLQKTEGKIQSADTDFQWAAAIAQFGMLLRDSKFKGNTTWDGLLEVATSLAQESKDTYRLQAVEMMQAAKQLQPK